MFTAWSALVYRLRWEIISFTFTMAVINGIWGAGVAPHLSAGGLVPAGTESDWVAEVTHQQLAAIGDTVLLYQGTDNGYGDPAFDAAVRSSVRALPRDAAPDTHTPWNTPKERADRLVSRDGRSIAVVVRLAGDNDTERHASLRRVRHSVETPTLRREGVHVSVTGPTAIRAEFRELAMSDLARAELVAFPLLLAALVWVFGSVTAATLLVAVGAVTAACSTAILRLMAAFTEVTTFALNVVVMLGLALTLDYALFMVSRFREELAAGREVPGALAAMMRTAGRTILVSGLIVTICASGLLVFDLGALRSLGLGGVAATFLAMTAALTVLPALLAVIGRGIDRFPVGRRKAQVPGTAATGVWARLARGVMARPLGWLAASTAVLVALGLPFAEARFTTTGPEVLPAHAESRAAYEALKADLPEITLPDALVVVTRLPRFSADETLNAYVEQVEALPGVREGRVLGRDRGLGVVAVDFAAEPKSDAARDVVRELRALAPPRGAVTAVGGQTAELIDTLSSVRGDLPVMLGTVVGVTLALLFIAFGSVLLPVKAVLVGALSLTACFGVVVWGFQDGHLAGPLAFTAPPGIDPSAVVLIAVIAFALSMDYEVFLLGRVREEWLRSGDNTAAVAAGMQRTAGLITRAALLMAIVIGALATAEAVLVKMIAVALLVAIFLDASLVRVILVPAAMRLLGRANWWLPRPFSALHRRIDVLEPRPASSSPPEPEEPDRPRI
ncbi:MMPL family transporter [Nocardiopsis rhodophaea]|uniref:MMPL family transporter n=1 Tax=Nocardiopsis rhodophaea TaxID=280238 RepID=A0ABP5EVW6_9ACTN